MRRVAYLHGVPGGPNELALFGGAPFAGCDLYVPDRTGAASKDLDALAAAIGAHFAGQAFDLVGFSLGGFVALEVAARLGAQVARIDLVAVAAPLESESDLATMAGAAVFRAARDAPWRLAVMVRGQALLGRIAPDMLHRVLFASARGNDASLAAQPHFRSVMRGLLASALRDGAPGYRRDLAAYVAPWSDCLAQVIAPVTLWHGTDDNWAPIAMAETLAAQMPKVVAFHRLDGLSHYSTLAHALAQIG